MSSFYFPKRYDLPFPEKKFPDKAPGVVEYMVQTQYDIPKRLNHYAEDYPALPWQRAQELYCQAVQEVINESGEKDLISGDLSFGRGYCKAEKRFIELVESKGYSKALHF